MGLPLGSPTSKNIYEVEAATLKLVVGVRVCECVCVHCVL